MNWTTVIEFLISFAAGYYFLCHGIKTKSAA